jgi:hypothetical protein
MVERCEATGFSDGVYVHLQGLYQRPPLALANQFPGSDPTQMNRTLAKRGRNFLPRDQVRPFRTFSVGTVKNGSMVVVR